jgi:hypothetical protein
MERLNDEKLTRTRHFLPLRYLIGRLFTITGRTLYTDY